MASTTPFGFLLSSPEKRWRGKGMKNFYLHAVACAVCICCLCSINELRAQNWIQAAGVPAVPILGVIEHRGDFYALSLDSIYRSVDSASTWSPTRLQPGHGDNLVSLFSLGNYVYLGTTNDGVYRSSDGGDNWEAFSEGYPGSTVVEFLSLGDSLYVGTAANGVYVRNIDQQSSWAPYNDGLERYGVETMAASGDLLVANIGLSTYARMRGSNAWTEFLIDSAGGQLSVNRFYRFGNFLFAGGGLGVYRGNADATGWTKVGINLLPYQPVVHFGAHGRRLLAAVRFKLEHFICYSDDEGSSWGVWAHELAELLSMSVVGNRVFAARADGLWYFDLGTPTGIGQPEGEVAEGFRLEQNYPNPFNPVTTIKYTIGAASPALRAETRGPEDRSGEWQ